MKNKKGFTLIELLAVIVILAIIALIAAPIVLKIISNSKESSAMRSAEIYIEAIETTVVSKQLSNEASVAGTYEIKEGNLYQEDKLKYEIKMKGIKPKGESITINDKGKVESALIVLNDYKYIYNGKNLNKTSKIEKTNTNSILINSSIDSRLINFRIYGNSIQNGIPTVDNPVKIESVGDKTKQLIDDSSMHNVAINNSKDWIKTSIKLEAGTYTAKVNFTDGSTYTGWMFPIYFGNNSNYNIKQVALQTKANTITLTEEEANQIDQYKVYTNISGNDGLNGKKIKNIQFVKGNYTDTTIPNYEPYGYKIPIKIKTRKKNYFTIDGFATTSSLLVTKINNTSFTLTAKTSGTYRQSGTKFLIRVSDLKNDFLTVKVENVIKTSVGTPLFVIRQYDKNMKLLAQLNNCQLKTSGVKVDLSNLNPETAWLGGILCLSNANETAGSYSTITDLQIYDGEDDSIITNIYLDEPLRKIGDYSDYIDFENQKIVRNVEVLDDSGNISIEKGLKPLQKPKEEYIELPKIKILKGSSELNISTIVKPSKIELEY